MLLLHGGRVLDGLGGDPVRADVTIDAGVIRAVRPVPTPAGESWSGGESSVAGGEPTGPDVRRMDVSGMLVLPGFVDVHAHDDLAVLSPELVRAKLRQGVTTVVVGNCGHGCAPSGPDGGLAEYSAPILGPFPAGAHWPAFADYLRTLESAPLAVNAAALVPHGPLRAAVIGTERRPATTAEIARMAELLDQALADGAVGLSLGLMYPPGNAAGRAELETLAAVVARHDRLLVAHMRNEADRILESVDEVASLAREAGCALHISHLKVTSPTNHGRMPAVLDVLRAWRNRRVDLTADIYPYVAGSTTAATLLPPWTAADGLGSMLRALRDQRERVRRDLEQPWGELENYFRSLGPDLIRLNGKSLSELARAEGRSPADCLCELLLRHQGNLQAVLFQQDERDIEAAWEWPWTMAGSDGLPLPDGPVHPRLYGTFARILERFTAERSGRGPSTAEAVRRMTSLASRRFGLPGRGVLRAGAPADVIVVDPERIRDAASYEQPRRHPDGILAVLVNGELAWPSSASESGVGTYGRLIRTRAVGRT